jgi:c-di-GMP-binding flagellar brake protein YcgR
LPGRPTIALIKEFNPPVTAEAAAERRGHLRLDAPVGHSFSAEFTYYGETYHANVYDLSTGGVGLRAAPRELPELYAGKRLTRVKLELGNERELTVDLEVRMWRPFRSFLLGQQVHIGCRFLELTPYAEAEVRLIVAELQSRR